MSKGNMLLGHARGKVGSLVFSRSNGQQITRAKAEVVKNPRTEAQMIQRIILNTVAQAYSRMKSICDHSFEGVQTGQKSMSYFMRTNLDAIRARVSQDIADGFDLGSIFAFSPVSTNEYAPAGYIISKGTLPEVVATRGTNNTAKVDGIAANTYQAIIDAFGLQRGDQLTFVATQGTQLAANRFFYARVILDPVDAEGNQLPLSTAFVVDGAIANPNPRNEGEFVTLTYADGAVSFNFSQQAITGAAVIVSRKQADGSWLRSNATLFFNPASMPVDAHSLQECLEIIIEGGISTTSSRYLNNAGTGKLASANAVAGNTLEAKTVGGQSVTLTALSEGDGALYAVANDGTLYFIKSGDTRSTAYGHYFTSFTTQAEAAPAGATDANTVLLPTADDATRFNDANWLIDNGMSSSVLFG